MDSWLDHDVAAYFFPSHEKSCARGWSRRLTTRLTWRLTTRLTWRLLLRQPKMRSDLALTSELRISRGVCCCRYSFCCLNSHHLLAAACGDPEITFANSFRGPPLKKCTNHRPFKLAMQHNFLNFPRGVSAVPVPISYIIWNKNLISYLLSYMISYDIIPSVMISYMFQVLLI